jgi:predicted lipase
LKKLKRYQYERYAVLCKLAYPKAFDYAALGYSEHHHYAVYNVHGAVVARILSRPKKKEVIVLFRGTQSLRDWLLNFCIFPSKAKGCFAEKAKHNGFVHFGYQFLLNQKSVPINFVTTIDSTPKQFLSVYEQIEQYLKPLIESGKRITFTGHSSGGAMAVLAAQRLELSFPRGVRRVVTFGQPSASFRRFYRHYLLHKRTFRVCCDLDIVTFLPPFPGLYKHLGRSLWLHDERIYENARPIWRFYRVVSRWLLSPISYHYMHKYIRDKDFFDEH